MKYKKMNFGFGFTLAEVLIAKRERGKMSLLNLFRTRELKAPLSIVLKQCAFTLAEVLITLGIIGVVAAMTIPTLVQNSQKQETVSGLKKAYSEISQAAKMSEIDNGAMPTWSVSAEWDPAAGAVFWNTYLIPYLSTIKVCTTDFTGCWASNTTYLDGAAFGNDNSFIHLVLKDGATLLFGGVNNNSGSIHIDINGLRPPNIVGKDTFRIDLGYKSGKIVFSGASFVRGDILGNYSNSCNKTPGSSKGNWCGSLIQQDGWQIKDDYPW